MKQAATVPLRRRGFSRMDAAAVFCLLFYTVYFLYLAPRGIHNVDESYYLTVPHRLLFGDRLIVDDWHVSQLSSIFQYPFFFLYSRVTGGTDGIILYFRYVYIVIQLLFCIWLYCNPHGKAAG